MSDPDKDSKATSGAASTAIGSKKSESQNDGPKPNTVSKAAAEGESGKKAEKSPHDQEKVKEGVDVKEDKSNKKVAESKTDAGEDSIEDPLVIDEGEESNNTNDTDESEEKEFEPTIDMMMNDFDDERTMEEEEALEGLDDDAEDAEDEVSALEQEGDMPLEELLKLYNYGGGATESTGGEDDTAAKAAKRAKEGKDQEQSTSNKEHMKTASSKKEEKAVESAAAATAAPVAAGEKRSRSSGLDDMEQQQLMLAADQESDQAEGRENLPPPAKKNRSELARFYESAVEGGRALRSAGGAVVAAGGGGGSSEDVLDEDGDSGDNGNGDESDGGGGGNGEGGSRDYSWKKTIMIGPSYQAAVPSGMSSYLGDTLPYENEDKLLWNPHSMSEKDAVSFLAKSQESSGQLNQGIGGLPLGAHVRDDEQALFLLLQCGYNSDEALRRRRMSGAAANNSASSAQSSGTGSGTAVAGSGTAAAAAADTMSLWSEEECRAFELGLRLYGKDFHMIQQQKVRTRSVGELVQFYYLWKKTERHDVFATATRLEKKKYALHPGTTDYMDRFIDEQDRDIGIGGGATSGDGGYGGLHHASSPATATYHSLLFDTRKGMSLKAMTDAAAPTASANGSDNSSIGGINSVQATAAGKSSSSLISLAADAASSDSSSILLATGNGSSVQPVPSSLATISSSSLSSTAVTSSAAATAAATIPATVATPIVSNASTAPTSKQQPPLA